jgi:SAM-dependent methyltransferase
VMQGDAALASFRDGTFDIILAHQILHHAIDPAAMLEKFAGLLKPGGLLLCAESCRAFVDSWPVKLLLRRPRGTQKTAQEYVQSMRAAGLIVDEHRVNTSRPWWTRRSLGLAQKIGIANHSEPTQVVLIARKPVYPEEGITAQENPAVTPRLSAD